MKKVTVRATRPLPQLRLDEVGVLDYVGNIPALIANGILELVGPDPESVPDGTVSFVLNWVGKDKEKALRVLDAESQKMSPRSGLVRKLSAILGDDKASQPQGHPDEATLLSDDLDAPRDDWQY